jgi:NAD+ diphosphatase
MRLGLDPGLPGGVGAEPSDSLIQIVSAPMTFAGAALDRAAAERRRPEWVEARREEPRARTVLLSPRGVWMEDRRLVLVPPGDSAVFLGLAGGVPLFATDVGDEEPARGAPAGLREAATELPADQAGLAAYAASLLSWHRRHRFCANCGRPTQPRDAGHERQCPACGAQHFPRTDPVVIVRVTDGARLLLGRKPRWPEGRYSVLAGFVEPGESLEDAVRREIHEEAGVEVVSTSYLASQPWPFPSSLMLGFHAVAESGEPQPTDVELADVRWFEPREVEDAAAGRSAVLLPPVFTIARRLINGWLRSAAQDGASGRSG